MVRHRQQAGEGQKLLVLIWWPMLKTPSRVLHRSSTWLPLDASKAARSFLFEAGAAEGTFCTCCLNTEAAGPVRASCCNLQSGECWAT